jgi:hypothetical protein
MVENQCASRDISQSKLAKATVSEKIRIPGALSLRSRAVSPQSRVSVHLHRDLMESVSEVTPDSKIDELANDKERFIQIWEPCRP